MTRPTVRLAALVSADLTALVVLFPGTDLAARVASPRLWLAEVGPDGAAAQLAAAGLWLAAVWLAIGLGATIAAALPGALGRAAGGLADRVLPRAVLRLVAGAAGLGVALAPATAMATTTTPTTAAAPSPISTAAPAWPTSAAPPAPMWPTGPAGPSAASAAPKPSSHPQHRAPNRPAAEPGVVVTSGDTLWSIAAGHLPPGQRTPARIAAAWPRWYAANRPVIGADPDHIVAGQVLHLPTHRHRGTESRSMTSGTESGS